ncbi:hypothetical protein B0H16DRAFT_1743547 [Mycena metata]|uniref:BHLH domain-containing protein n=1 Tax=Mycena metata TaxID=1033252 RepID=A0AAD7H5Y1_9AGAR|nr:hypothetical protein B0H16DRAFT_1743547 [Mycena metata]
MSTLMNDDLAHLAHFIGLDPSDPLNLLLHNHSQRNMQASDDDSSPSPEDKMEDMSQFTSMDLGMGMGIDITDFGLFNPFHSPRGGSIGFLPPAVHATRKPRLQERGPRPRRADRKRAPPAFTALLAPSYPPPNTAASALTTVPVAPSAPPTPATPVQTATQSRPKTSHKTIERRYRTNLNTRIHSLHQVVPALRIRGVVDRVAMIKAGESYPGPERKPAAPVQEGEKKKRGRPRKVEPLPASATASASTNSSHAGSPVLSTSVPMHSSTAVYAQRQQEIMHHQQDLTGAPRRYLLGAFALFSFFANANVSSPSPLPTPNLHPTRTRGARGARPGAHGHGHRRQGIWPRGRGRGRDGPAAGVSPPRECSGADERCVARVEGVWARYVASASPSRPTLLEKTKVEGKKEEEEGSETDGERSAGSVGSAGISAPRGGGVYSGWYAKIPLPSSLLILNAYNIILTPTLHRLHPLRTRLRTAFRLHLFLLLQHHHLFHHHPRSGSGARSSTATADDSRRLLALLVCPVPLLGTRVAPRLWAVEDAVGQLGARM